MKCMYCPGDTKVVNSRPQKRTNSIWRRRECLECHTVFTSIEEADLSKSIVVRQKSALEPFSRDKLLLSIHDSLRHRKTALEDATALTDTIISQVLTSTIDAILDRDVVVHISLTTLQHFDPIAATHYSAFHPISS